MYPRASLFVFKSKLPWWRSASEAHLEPSQTSKMEILAHIVKSWKLLTIFAKNSILDIWLGFEYASICTHYTKQKKNHKPKVAYQRQATLFHSISSEGLFYS